MGQYEKVSWKCMMFQNPASPKAIFILWVHLLGRLHTTNRLRAWGIDVPGSCIFCRQEDETNEHLFASCTFSREVWNRLIQWLDQTWSSFPSYQQHQLWMIKKCKRKSVHAILMKMAYTEFVYSIWRERNHMIFQHTEKSAYFLARETAFQICVRAPDRCQGLLQRLVF